jgi:uncharacterized protein YbjT (DUF2867 family)
MFMVAPILVTGAGGQVGGVGRSVAERLLKRGLPVRAVDRHDDERAAELRRLGAEVVIADLTNDSDVVRVMRGCKRIHFGLSIDPDYLQTTVLNAAVAKMLGGIEVFVNMSQMTVSQMKLGAITESHQQRQHLLAEKALDWSGLPVVHIRPTVFLQTLLGLAADSIKRDGTIRLPFGDGRTSPVDASDVADVIATVLADPTGHIGHVYELTGPKSLTLNELAAEFSLALDRPVRYVDVPYEPWSQNLRNLGLSDHLAQHVATIARLHAQNRYDRRTDDVEKIGGHPATSAREFMERNAAQFDVAVSGYTQGSGEGARPST